MLINKNKKEIVVLCFTSINQNLSNFQTLLNPRKAINDLNDNKNLKLLKKITDRHNVNILATR